MYLSETKNKGVEMGELTFAATEIVPIDNATFAYPADANPALAYLAAFGSNGSRLTMRKSLNVIARDLGMDDYRAVPWHAIRHQHVNALRATLADRYSASTANRHMAALRGVLKECWLLQYMAVEDYQRAINFKPIKGSTASQAESGRHLGKGELGALLAACADGTKAGARDAAIVAVAYNAGLRRSEIAGLALSDHDSAEDSLRIRHGKGNKERVVYLDGGAVYALADWLLARGDAPGALFLASRKGDNLLPGGMTDQAIYKIFATRAKQANVKAFSPHDLRRTFAGDMLDAGADISTVQKIMGHSSANTTASYDRRDKRTKKAAAGLLHVPYIGSGGSK